MSNREHGEAAKHAAVVYGLLAEQTYLTMGWQVGKQPVEVPGDWQSPPGSTAASGAAGQVLGNVGLDLEQWEA